MYLLEQEPSQERLLAIRQLQRAVTTKQYVPTYLTWDVDKSWATAIYTAISRELSSN